MVVMIQASVYEGGSERDANACQHLPMPKVRSTLDIAKHSFSCSGRLSHAFQPGLQGLEVVALVVDESLPSLRQNTQRDPCKHT